MVKGSCHAYVVADDVTVIPELGSCACAHKMFIAESFIVIFRLVIGLSDQFNRIWPAAAAVNAMS